MRHGKKFNHLGRIKPHRKAMLSNMACSLIEHKRISTTVAKAKALRQFVEPLITKSKVDSTHSRRQAFRYLQSKDAVSTLYREIAPKVADRPGGYLRILKTGARLGDNAEMAIVELVDFNELYSVSKTEGGKKKRTRRGRRGSTAAKATAPAEATEEKAEEVKAEETAVAEEVTEPAKEEKPEEATEEKKEAKTDKKAEEVKEEPAEKAEEVKAEAEAETAEAEETSEKEPKAKDEKKEDDTNKDDSKESKG